MPQKLKSRVLVDSRLDANHGRATLPLCDARLPPTCANHRMHTSSTVLFTSQSNNTPLLLTGRLLPLASSSLPERFLLTGLLLASFLPVVFRARRSFPALGQRTHKAADVTEK